MTERDDNHAAREHGNDTRDAQASSREVHRRPDEPAAYGAVERLAERLRDLGLWLMRLVS